MAKSMASLAKKIIISAAGTASACEIEHQRQREQRRNASPRSSLAKMALMREKSRKRNSGVDRLLGNGAATLAKWRQRAIS